MSPSIHDVVRSKDWAEVRSRLGSGESTQFNSDHFNGDGFNAFHIACGMADVPSDIISRIAFVDNTVLTTTTEDGKAFTPLHLACESGSVQTVRMLLSLEPDVEKMKKLAVEECRRGDKPLHAAWASQLDTEWEPHFGESPTQEDVSALLHHLDAVPSVGDLNDKARELWDKTLAILFAANTGCMFPSSNNGKQWTVLHSMTDQRYVCPVIALWLGLKHYSSQAKWVNDEGDLPLHVAASWGGHYRRNGLDSSDETTKAILDRAGRSPTQMLVECFPDAAMMIGRDGRLPLHHLADTGSPRTWEDEFEPLLKACPKAIDTRDPVTHLFPFMLRAVDEDDDHPESTNDIYILLRKNPDNVKGGIRNTAYEDYLEAKLDQKTKEAGKEALDKAKSAEEYRRSLAEKEAQLQEFRLQLKKRKAETRRLRKRQLQEFRLQLKKRKAET